MTSPTLLSPRDVIADTLDHLPARAQRSYDVADCLMWALHDAGFVIARRDRTDDLD